MVLSYALRIACLIGVSMGLLQTGFEIFLWLASPAVLRLLGRLPLRTQERALYLVQLLPCGFAALFTAFCCLPRYLANETNFNAERVGWLPVVVASGLALWWAARLSFGVRMVVRTALFSREMRGRRASPPAQIPVSAIEVVAIEGSAPRVALVGLMRPFILISKSLMESGGLDPLALQVVLDHERSHAAERDNWKLLSLHCLPRFGVRLHAGKSWMQLWRNVAERAADEDAVQGSSSRAFVLAETLVALARFRPAKCTPIACTNFACDDTELASRVKQLIQAPSPKSSALSYKVVLAFGFIALAAIFVVVDVASVLGDLPEHILHLG